MLRRVGFEALHHLSQDTRGIARASSLDPPPQAVACSRHSRKAGSFTCFPASRPALGAGIANDQGPAVASRRRRLLSYHSASCLADGTICRDGCREAQTRIGPALVSHVPAQAGRFQQYQCVRWTGTQPAYVERGAGTLAARKSKHVERRGQKTPV
jgi:hypothetical protein